jgi:peptide/nickel transport system permease protein
MTLSASDLEILPTDESAGATEEAAKVQGRSPTQLALRRFRKDKASMGAFFVVVAFAFVAIAAPFLVKFDLIDPFTFHNSGENNLLDIEAGSIPAGSWGGISGDHWLGIEPGTGRDVMARLIYGMTWSLTIALAATAVTMVIGTVLGIISGFSGGIVDMIIGRGIDLVLSFPSTLMLLALSGPAIQFLEDTAHVPAGDPANAVYVILVLGLFGWPSVARVVRGQVLSIREREFVEAAKLIGASRPRIYFKEILPNVWAPLLVMVTLLMPAFVSAEAALSFLAVGVKPPTPTLGNILKSSVSYADADFVFFFLPALLIAIIVISFNLAGDGLRDALDPKTHR